MKHLANKHRWAAIIILASVMALAGSAWVWSVATGSLAAHATVHQVSGGSPLLGPPWG